jgi:hypothetical protein
LEQEPLPGFAIGHFSLASSGTGPEIVRESSPAAAGSKMTGVIYWSTAILAVGMTAILAVESRYAGKMPLLSPQAGSLCSDGGSMNFLIQF